MTKPKLFLVKILTVTLFLLSNIIYGQTPLSGTYTIDPSGSGDFISFTTAVNALDSFGVSGPTIFEVLNGVYVEQIKIAAITGVSIVNTVKFESQSGIPSNVTIMYSAGDSLNNYVVNLVGVEHVIFEGLTMKNQTPLYSDVLVMDSIDGVTINNCHLIITDTIYQQGIPVRSFSVTNNFSLIQSKLIGGAFSLSIMDSLPNQYSNNVVIEHNLFLEASQRGGNLHKINNLHFNHNYTRLSQNGLPTHGFIFVGINQGEIKFNHVEGTSHGLHSGFYIESCNGTYSNPLEVIGNRVYIEGFVFGVLSQKNSFVSYNHNSVFGYSTGYVQGFSSRKDTNITVNNNIIQIEGSGKGLELDSVIAFSSNYNCISLTGANSVAVQQDQNQYANLGSWNLASGQDSNSISVNTIFYDTVNLLVCADSLFQKGLFYPPSLADFEGDVRQDPPCIGADEFLPPADLSMIADTVLCDGDTLNYTFNTGFVVWNNIDTLNNYYITALGPQTIAAYGGCGADTVNFNVLQQDYAVISDTHICDGEVAFIDCGILNGTYQWSNGSNGQITLINSPQTLIVNVIDSFGCASSDVAIISQSTDVDLPDSAIFCSGNNVILDANVPSSYLWSTGSITQTISVSSQGWYLVTVTDQNCVSSDSTYVTEVFNVIPSFNDSSDFFTVWFTNTSQNADYYSWNFGDGTISSDVHPIHVFPYSTQNVELYTVTLTAYNSCGDNEIINDGVRVGQLVSVSEIELASMISVYPNPSNGVFTVNLTSINSSVVLVEVLDVRGAIVFTQNVGAIQGNLSQPINAGHLVSGVYFVRVSVENENAVYRIVVE